MEFENNLMEFKEWLKNRQTKISEKTKDFLNRDIVYISKSGNVCLMEQITYLWSVPKYVIK